MMITPVIDNSSLKRWFVNIGQFWLIDWLIMVNDQNDDLLMSLDHRMMVRWYTITVLVD